MYSRSTEENWRYLSEVLETLRKEKLYVKFSKCEFWLREVHFLGHVVGADGIKVDPAKIVAVREWPDSKTPTVIHNFVGWQDITRELSRISQRSWIRWPS